MCAYCLHSCERKSQWLLSLHPARLSAIYCQPSSSSICHSLWVGKMVYWFWLSRLFDFFMSTNQNRPSSFRQTDVNLVWINSVTWMFISAKPKADAGNDFSHLSVCQWLILQTTTLINDKCLLYAAAACQLSDALNPSIILKIRLMLVLAITKWTLCFSKRIVSGLVVNCWVLGQNSQYTLTAIQKPTVKHDLLWLIALFDSLYHFAVCLPKLVN